MLRLSFRLYSFFQFIAEQALPFRKAQFKSEIQCQSLTLTQDRNCSYSES